MRPHLPDEILSDDGVQGAWDQLTAIIGAENASLERWARYGGGRGFDERHAIKEWELAALHRSRLKKVAAAFETAVLEAMVRHHDQPDYVRYYSDRWMQKLEARGDAKAGRDERNMPIWIWRNNGKT